MDAILYVIRSPSGLRKVGYTECPRQRFRGIVNSNSIREAGEFTAEHAEPCKASLARLAERHAHQLLEDDRVRGEWFSCDLETAVMAILSGIRDAETGREVPTSRLVRTEKVTILVTKAEFRAIEDAMHRKRMRSISTFVRDLIAKHAADAGVSWPDA